VVMMCVWTLQLKFNKCVFVVHSLLFFLFGLVCGGGIDVLKETGGGGKGEERREVVGKAGWMESCFVLFFVGFFSEKGEEREGSRFLQERAASLLLGLLLVVGVGLADLPDEVVEDLVDVDLGLGRGLKEGAAAKLAGEALTLLGGDDALVLQVALVSDENHGDRVAVLDAEDLLAEVREVVERGLGNDTVNKDESLAVLHVQVTHGSELLSSGGIKDFEHVLVGVNLDGLAVRVLDGGIVLLNEDALDKLHSKGGLSDTS
jgi:hypothetical protein